MERELLWEPFGVGQPEVPLVGKDKTMSSMVPQRPELQTQARLRRDLDRLFDRELVVLGILDDALHVAAGEDW